MRGGGVVVVRSNVCQSKVLQCVPRKNHDLRKILNANFNNFTIVRYQFYLANLTEKICHSLHKIHCLEVGDTLHK